MEYDILIKTTQAANAAREKQKMKNLILITLITATVFGLTACGKKQAQEKNVEEESFKIPGLNNISFNWKFAPDDYRKQGFIVRHLGTNSGVEEYTLTNRSYESFTCLKNTSEKTPFCFIFSGKIAKAATNEIADALKDPVRMLNYARIRSFDTDNFDNHLSSRMGFVLSSSQFKILLHFDRKDNAKMVIYQIDDNRDETYYDILR